MIPAIRGNRNNEVGRNKMAKSRRKKNYKLRKRVMRTIAALTMIMAIVVAAIPVENYGSMQAAADQNFDMSTIYSQNGWTDIAQANESSYNQSEITIQRIENGVLTNAYKAVPNNGGTAIASGVADRIPEITIRPTEYYNYVVFDNAYINALTSQLESLNYEITFKDVTLPNSLTGGSYVLDDSSQATGAQLSAINNVKKLDPQDYSGNSISLSAINNAVYGTVKSNHGKTYADIFKNCEQAALNDRQNEINAYNSLVDSILTIQTKVTANQPLTSGDVDTWNSFNSNWQEQYTRAKTLSRTYSELTSTNTSTGLKSALEYILLNCYTNSGQNGNQDLSRYNLEGVSVEAGGPSYVAKLASGNNHDTHQKNDAAGYLVAGEIKIRGIKSSAFKNASLNTVTIQAPSPLTGTDEFFVGKEAFVGSAISTVNIDAAYCTEIGDRAFLNTSLQTVNFANPTASSLKRIGNQAFDNTRIREITIPYSNTTVGAGCFENSTLEEVTFTSGGAAGGDIDIGEYSFYNCKALRKVTFQNDRRIEIKKGAFALDRAAAGGSDELEFSFPVSSTQINHDYILAGRANLKSVTFPGGLSGSIPDNTLKGCHNLTVATFPDGASGASYTSDKLFQDVTKPEFYVAGPKLTSTGSDAKPRQDTWKATYGYQLDGKDAPVPYMYEDADGKHFEIGYEKGDYVATIDVLSDTEYTARLSKYEVKGGNSTDRIPLTIATVGRYTITEIGDNCFDADAKARIYKLTIADGSVRKINANAFEGAKALQQVYIGNAVDDIGSRAFADCEKLENVYFSTANTQGLSDDDAHWQDLKVADDAFSTQSEWLIFHGSINPAYRPYQIAMSDNNSSLLRSSAQVCYKTDTYRWNAGADEPVKYDQLNLTVIRNRADGKATLVDYPHYEDMEQADREAFEKVYIDRDDTATIDSDKAATVMQTLHMQLPKGIESIDTKAFFDAQSGNREDYPYIEHTYEETTDASDRSQNRFDRVKITRNINGNVADENDIQRLYSDDTYQDDSTYADVVNDENVSIGGLFSGFFKEATNTASPYEIWDKPYNNHTYREDYHSGNDYLTSIDMRSIESLPDFAFDSNENLLAVTLGGGMGRMGRLPFRGCKRLNAIDTQGNDIYSFDNMILYENKGDSTNISNMIVQCLEGRGTRGADDGANYGTTTIDVGTNPLLSTVTSIAEGAFSNCLNIRTVDLSATKVVEIPEWAFENAEYLTQVKLPETVAQIDEHAFDGTGGRVGTLTVEVPNPLSTINANAFNFDVSDGGVEDVTIIGIKYVDETTKTESPCFRSFLSIQNSLRNAGEDPDRITFREDGSTYTLEFVDDMMEPIGTYTIEVEGDDEEGGRLENPPTAPVKNGKKFTTWVCRLSDGTILRGEDTYSKVKEDRLIMAQYEDDPQTVVPDGHDHTLTVVNGTALINGNPVSTFPVTVEGGTRVMVVAADMANFRVWTITSSNPSGINNSIMDNSSAYMTTFTMQNADLVVTANTAIGGGTDTPNPDGTYKVTVNNGTGSGNYRPGATVTITANTPPAGQTFVNWTTTTADVKFASATTATTTFVMPAANVNVTANFSGGNGGNNNNPGGDGNNPGGSDSGKKYKVTVNYGSGSGEYAAGATVNITANAPESSSRVFSRWTTNNSGLGFANANSVSTSFVMPAADVTVTANYKTRSSDDDDDDDDGPSRRPGTNTSTSTVPNRPSSSTSTTGTNGTVNNTTNGTTNNGNKIYITKNGISNTDVASLAVSGSTDNFIVRITESPEATAAVEQSLTNTYGSLNGLAYLPMDISLYDSTGQNKITDSTGLNITVTMPIPDVLIQYGGNARVAAADNGNLQQITPRFTTIDGIACVSFVPPHFSPYVIYVDTNNLIAGQMLDSTPATGDPIHPKWFAAIGMACVSILLFVLSDGRKRRKYRAA